MSSFSAIRGHRDSFMHRPLPDVEPLHSGPKKCPGCGGKVGYKTFCNACNKTLTPDQKRAYFANKK